MLEIGMKAPDFTLKDKNGNDFTLSSLLGKKVVLYFYPKDNTPGCTRQACAFAGAYKQFEAKGVEVVGISKDSVASHVKFAEKYDLPFSINPTHQRLAHLAVADNNQFAPHPQTGLNRQIGALVVAKFSSIKVI